MILWLLNWLGGWYAIRGEGSDSAAFLNLCLRGCYPYWAFCRDSDGFSFRVRCRVWRELSAVCTANGLCLSIEREGGLPRLLRRYRRRWGMMAGIVLAVGILWLSGQFVWRIEVTGTSRYRVQDVLDELASVVATSTSHNRHTACNVLLCKAQHFVLLVGRKGGSLGCCAEAYYIVGSSINHIVEHRAK